MPKRTYTSLPENYPVCLHANCKVASSCLHQLAYPKLLESDTFLHLINPNKCCKSKKCEFYRNSAPVTYARGFTNFQKKMYPQQYREFMDILKGVFGRNAYFERRSGVSALSPKEQEVVLDALKKVGVTAEMKFDSYEENTNWYD